MSPAQPLHEEEQGRHVGRTTEQFGQTRGIHRAHHWGGRRHRQRHGPSPRSGGGEYRRARPGGVE
ncbi:hypothetical protein ACFPRL_33145 [Pseudoclavibacter helvolus]